MVRYVMLRISPWGWVLATGSSWGWHRGHGLISAAFGVLFLAAFALSTLAMITTLAGKAAIDKWRFACREAGFAISLWLIAALLADVGLRIIAGAVGMCSLMMLAWGACLTVWAVISRITARKSSSAST